jgi:hypothetical protein
VTNWLSDAIKLNFLLPQNMKAREERKNICNVSEILMCIYATTMKFMGVKNSRRKARKTYIFYDDDVHSIHSVEQ